MAAMSARAVALAGAREKVNRAVEQFNSLQAEVGPWVEGQPQELFVGFEAQTQRWSYALINPGDAPPLRFAVIIGRSSMTSGRLSIIWSGNLPKTTPRGMERVNESVPHLRQGRPGPEEVERPEESMARHVVQRRTDTLRHYQGSPAVSSSTSSALLSTRRVGKPLEHRQHNVLVGTVVGVVPNDAFPWFLRFDPLPS